MGWVSLLLLLPLLLRAGDRSLCTISFPFIQVCGKTLTQGRILGGQETTLIQWPWQASLKYKTHHWCRVTLIHSSWVMTAAHCFQQNAHDPGAWKVQLGSRTIKPHKLSFSYLHSRRVTEIILHPFYFGGPPKDIALAKLQSPIRFKRSILPICLPTSTTQFENVTMCWVTGWGRIKEHEYPRKPWNLQAVELPLIDQKTCDLYYHIGTKLPPFISRIYDDMICAGFKEGKKDACHGDSGGPLACEVKGIWHQAGIVSWGDGCGRPYRPSVFTNVSVHTDWILRTIKSNTFSLMPSKLLFLLTLQLS
ncbi:testisin-like [Vombatus ursinus]|uniref:Peptidase S1 domain-containing protein n=1 Tax=Vombatus ursinus TaxID=29139 RepID=A0A4X2JNG1_VOMUR|nr:testisin-like [Vombatus ursinus]